MQIYEILLNNQNRKTVVNQRFNIICNLMECIKNRLIIWRSLVQAQAGPR